jgi:DNA-binding beta-propeller fold protein YncE
MMLRGVALFLVLSTLVWWGGPNPAAATVEWSRLGVLPTDGAPVDMAVSADGKYTFVLTDTGRVVLYSDQGHKEGTLDVGRNIIGIASSPTGDQLYLLDRDGKAVQTVGVDFIQQINTAGDPFKGQADAPVVVALFSDFQ